MQKLQVLKIIRQYLIIHIKAPEQKVDESSHESLGQNAIFSQHFPPTHATKLNGHEFLTLSLQCVCSNLAR